MAVGDLYCFTPGGRLPFQPGPVIAYVCGPVPVVRLPGHLKDIGPAIEHGEKVITAVGVRQTQHIRLLAHVEEAGGV